MNARRMRGVTLVEALTVIAILSVLAGAGVPAFVDLVRTQRARAAALDLVDDLALARSEAIKRATPVALRPAAGGWSAGWTVRVAGGLRDGEVVERRDGTGAGVSIEAPATIVYDRDGRLADGGTVRAAVIDTDRGTTVRCVRVALSGVPRSIMGSCG